MTHIESISSPSAQGPPARGASFSSKRRRPAPLVTFSRRPACSRDAIRRRAAGSYGCQARAGAVAAQAATQAAADSVQQPGQLQLVRIYTATDLHCDYKENMEAIRGWEARKDDVLICCGDVSDDLDTLAEALALLRSKYAAVFFCVGNHEVWVRQRDRAAGVEDSLTKLRSVLELCARLGVHVTPQRLGRRLWIAPLLSWHHKSWDKERDIPENPPASALTVSDYAATHWPPSVPGAGDPGSEALAHWFDSLNDTAAWDELVGDRQRQECDVITCSHFLPLQQLLPEKRFLFFGNLAKAVGSNALAGRLQAVTPNIHLFGHSHFSWDATADGVRYIQAPLCSPLERQRRLRTIGFEASMAKAAADPLAASWLPVCVYQTLATAEELQALAGGHDRGRDASLSSVLQRIDSLLLGPAAGQQGSSRDSSSRPGQAVPAASATTDATTASSSSGGGIASSLRASSNSTRDDAREWELLATLDAQLHGVVPSDETETEGEPPEAADAARCTLDLNPSSSRSSAGRSRLDPALQVQQEAWAAEGMQLLRHGAMAGPLGAHWSAYYESFPRTPDNTTLAPWVAKRYSKRRQRQAAQASGVPAGTEMPAP